MEETVTKTALTILGVLCMAVVASAAIKTETIEYTHGDVVLQGYMAYDDATTDKRPGILVVHEWMGINDYARGRAEQLAALGYVAFALDMYGKDVKVANAQEASTWAGKFYTDRQLMRDRANAGLEQLRSFRLTDPTRLAAIGYCFGGSTVLELARGGTTINGVVSFHGNLANPTPSNAANIKTKVLVCHGVIDPYVPIEQVNAFVAEMDSAKVDYQLVMYANAVHGFTNPNNGTDNAKGAAYNELADKRSWEAIKSFFGEIFGK
ncbi:MAG: dienelactone hydrolase family protein [bacterium]|nr:dienelactone hydrolase family protein [bacterium]